MSARGESGAAVITALLVVALAATAASFMMWQNYLWLRQVENLASQAQARAVARAGIDWGRAILDEDSRDVDHGGEQWAVVLPPLSVEGGEVSGGLSDAQGVFNLNNVVRGGKASPSDVALLQRLMEQLRIDPQAANALVDWMDTDDAVTEPGGAEDMQYLALDPPYRAANRALSEVGELYRVKGFTPDMVERLRPFVTALPEPTPINVNSAPAEVLAALCQGLRLADAKVLVERRGGTPFRAKSEFRELLAQGIPLREEDFSVNSRYFLAQARARQGRVQLAWQALLQRPTGGKTRMVWFKPLEE